MRQGKRIAVCMLLACLMSSPLLAETTTSMDGSHQSDALPTTDADIAKEILNRLAEEASMTGSNITVTIKEGTAFLGGTALTQVQATEAENIAKTVPGVKEVRTSVVVVSPDSNQEID